MSRKETEEHERTQNRQFHDLENPLQQPTPRFNSTVTVHSREMAEKANKKDFQLMKEAWKAVQKAKEELTTAQERADALAGDAVKLPELPVSSEKEVHAVKYLKDHHDYQGKISRELPEKAKAAIKEKARELKVIVKD